MKSLSLSAAFGLAFTAASAQALQPLSSFVQAAQTGNVDLKESRANAASAAAAHEVDIGKQLPSVNLHGGYTRNQYAVVLPESLLDPQAPQNATLTLTPYNQWDFYGTLNVPLIDLASFWRIRASGTSDDAAAKSLEATRLQAEAQVVQDYYQLVANLALVNAAQLAKEVAEASRDITLQLVQSGRAPALEQDRAVAEVERQVQQLAQAQLSVVISARALETASGLAPDLAAEPPLDDDLHAEAPEATFAPPAEGTPAMAAAALSLRTSELQAKAARFALIPALTGNVSEHSGNYLGFSGQSSAFTGALQLQWQLDFTTFANWKLQDAQVAVAQAHRERAALASLDAIHNTWASVESARARSRSARAEEEASQHAATLAKDRYQVGAATQLDLLQADRDAFAARVARIQADADLVNARIQLRLSAGLDPFAAQGASR